jgi:proteasome lid subunit RPN8/RPN11
MKIQFGEPIDFEIPAADFPLKSLPTGLLAARADVKVFVYKPVHDQIIDHVNQDKRIESGGILVGYPFQDPETGDLFVVIVGTIPDLSTNRSLVHFTVSPDDISRTRQVLEKNYPGLIAVGWYHSHPGHGVFLSGQDMTIVQGIYNEPWHLAWVIDPVRNLEGIFLGPEGTPLVRAAASYSILKNNRLWIAIEEYPACIAEIQDQAKSRANNQIEEIATEPPRKKKMEAVVPHRDKVVNYSKPYLAWVSMAFFVLSISLGIFSFMNSSFNLAMIALLLTLATISFSLYVLTPALMNPKRYIISSFEKITFPILIIGLIIFWIGYIALAIVDNQNPYPAPGPTATSTSQDFFTDTVEPNLPPATSPALKSIPTPPSIQPNQTDIIPTETAKVTSSP